VWRARPVTQACDGVADAPDLVPIWVENSQASDPRDVHPGRGAHDSSVVAYALFS
jgi:hypothetical protein